MIETYTQEFENSLKKLIGGKIRRILYDKSEIYYGFPCILNAEWKLVFELSIDDKYYEFIIKGVDFESTHDNIKLSRFWPGVFGHRLIFKRKYLNAFTFLTNSTYSCDYDLEVTSIEVYVSTYSADTSIFGYIIIYLGSGYILQIHRHHNNRYIELTISDSNCYSNSSIEEDYKLFKIINTNT